MEIQRGNNKEMEYGWIENQEIGKNVWKRNRDSIGKRRKKYWRRMNIKKCNNGYRKTFIERKWAEKGNNHLRVSVKQTQGKKRITIIKSYMSTYETKYDGRLITYKRLGTILEE